MYIIKGRWEFAEKDEFEKGCIPNTGWSNYDNSFYMSSDNLSALIFKLERELNITSDDYELDSCDEDGRISIMIMVDEQGVRASKTEIEQWKQGKKELYNLIQTVYVKHSVPVKLK